MSKIKRYANCLCVNNILKIGGVESVLWELANKCKKEGYELTIFYIKSDPKQLERLEKLLGKENVIKYEGQIIYCEVAFFNYDISYINNVFADKIYEVIHANFDIQKEFPPHLHDKITDYLAVSKSARDGFIKRTNGRIKPKLCYSPIEIRPEDKEKVLMLISCTRLSYEKGKDNMIAFANELDRQKRKYIWLVFTNDIDDIKNPNIIYMPSRLDVRPYIKMVGEAGGYCVQFSKSEGRCTTILEALNLNCPVIVSDIEAFREMGINEEYGFILPIPFKHIPIDEIYSKKFNFKFKNEKDGYDKYLTKGKSKYVEEKLMRVKIIREVFDTVAKIHYVPKEAMINPKNALDGYPNKEIGTIIDVNENRAKYIVASGYGIYVDEVKRTKSKKKVK